MSFSSGGAERMNLSANCAPAVAATPAPARLVIKGTTLNGRPFRPSDWAQRLATAVGGRDRAGRIRFHPQVRVVIADGLASVVVDGALARTDPPLYAFLRNFASVNNLQLSEG
jgi:hypothetical protein